MTEQGKCSQRSIKQKEKCYRSNFFWNEVDLQNKLDFFQKYHNESRGHGGINGNTPRQKASEQSSTVISLNHYRWKKHCRGLFQLPIAA